MATDGNPTPVSSAGAKEFRTTHWSVVLAAGRDSSPDARAALERLCRDYWYPLYAFARRDGRNPHDAQDLTQEFFAGFLRKKSVAQARPERGRFRCYLLASFRHFLANEYHRQRTAKRGGRSTVISLDEAAAEAQYGREPSHSLSPEKLFDQAWALSLLDKVMRNLQREYASAGKGRIFHALEGLLMGEKSELTYEEVGGQIQMNEPAVKMAALRLRRRYRELLRGEVAHTVSDAALIDAELRELFSVMY